MSGTKAGVRSARRQSTDARTPAKEAVEPTIRMIERRLRRLHGTPRLGNPRNPLDDLVFILLSGRTRGRVHERVFRKLKDRFRTWAAALRAGPAALFRVVKDAGLGRKRATRIWAMLGELRRRFGKPTLSPVCRMNDRAAEELLTALPGVGLKTARCVMLYTMDRLVFPVDAHTIRILGYFGLVNPMVRQEYAQDPVQALVRPKLRLSLHVNLVAHGRIICKPQCQACDLCPLNDLCPASTCRFPERGASHPACAD